MSMRFVVLAALLAAVGCNKGEPQSSAPAAPAATAEVKQPAAAAPAAAPAISDAARKEANDIFGSRCTPCHGPQGKGDGPASAALTPKPRNFTDPAWQDSVTDEHIEKIIQYGGAAVGKSPAMPANPDLTSKPEVVSALRAHVRSLKGK